MIAKNLQSIDARFTNKGADALSPDVDSAASSFLVISKTEATLFVLRCQFGRPTNITGAIHHSETCETVASPIFFT